MLADGRFDGAWTSDLARARATARLAWGRAVPEPRLREIDFGALEGRRWNRLDAEARRALDGLLGFHAWGGESVADVRRRVGGFLDALPAGRHLVFTHGAVIRLLAENLGAGGYVPTGSVVAVDWRRRRLLFVREGAGPRPGTDR